VHQSGLEKPVKLRLIDRMIFTPGALGGTVRVPGDKSISHRALMLAACSAQPVSITNLNPGRDIAATCTALRALGATVQWNGDDATVTGGTLHDADDTIDCMNSGSTARMISGLCAGANLRARLDGDESLRRRPMEPAAAQLRAFGARIETTNGRLPAQVAGTPAPQTRSFILLSPSAQVKTALLLAGVFSRTAITITGDKNSRDHTERLLRYWGAAISSDRERVVLESTPASFEPVRVAGDFSAAAFFIVAATVTPGSALQIKNVGVNPTRTGLLDALREMGSDIRLENEREESGEPVADIVVRHARLRGAAVGHQIVTRAIDEIPVLAVAAAFAAGETRITGIGDLRNKESDRVAAIVRLLEAAGIGAASSGDAIAIGGGVPRAQGAIVETHGDHRTAMAAAALASGAGALEIDDSASIAVSFPGFIETWQAAQDAA
jgi:3-phosphoshikimate 1-carboxyvinyltransferase